MPLSEKIQGPIEVGFSDTLEVGRLKRDEGDLVYTATGDPEGLITFTYFDTARSLDEYIEGLQRARREVFGTKP